MSGLTGELFLCLERIGDPPDMFVCRDMAGLARLRVLLLRGTYGE